MSERRSVGSNRLWGPLAALSGPGSGTSPSGSRYACMPRILISCPAGAGVVSTGYRTQDVDLAADRQPRSFRCACRGVHTWDASTAWAEDGMTDSAKRAYGLRERA